MTEEEKKAINNFKKGIEETKKLGKKYGFQEVIKNNDILLNYIEKLQKENEYYKKENSRIKKDLNTTLNYSKKFTISKDKIRNEIKELEEILEKRNTIDIIEEINRLQELLGE